MSRPSSQSPVPIGETLRQRRVEVMEKSLRDTAKRLQITPAHLSDLENGRRTPSEELLLRIRDEITELAEQVWIRLSENRRMVVDFVYVEADGTRRYVDAKGYATPEWKVKRDWARELGIEVETI